jgi:hypothetical protein
LIWFVFYKEIIMYRIPLSGLILFSVVGLLAADATWNTKEVAQWNKEDAQQLLADSPWVKRVTPAIMPAQNEALRRQAGQMGGANSVGLQALRLPTFFGGGPTGKEQVRPGALTLRWESALPVRAAEVKAGEAGAPVVEEGSYAVAVYGLPSASIDGNLKLIGGNLQKFAVLKHTGKKEIKPSRVDIIQETDGVVLVYVFPRPTEITKEDIFEFNAQMGRYFVAQPFAASEMQFQGKLEL